MKNKTEVEKRFDKLIMLLVKNGVDTEVQAPYNQQQISSSMIIFTNCEDGRVIFDCSIDGKTFITVNDALMYICEYREDILKELYEKLDEEHNPNIDYIEYILTKLTRRDILEQLSEEASELSQAANEISISANYISQYSNKMIRASEKTNNVTPMPKEGVANIINGCLKNIRSLRTENLEEECGDVNMCMDLLHHIDDGKPIEEFETLDNSKWERWAKRLGFICFEDAAKKSDSDCKPWGIRRPVIDPILVRIAEEAEERGLKLVDIREDD